jgi:hypothetical protein
MRTNGCKRLARAITNERIIQMDDVYGCDETVVNGSDPTILNHGDYLLIEHETNTRYIYRRAADDAPLHPLVSRIRHGGSSTRLNGLRKKIETVCHSRDGRGGKAGL